jgi:hypothetical protein
MQPGSDAGKVSVRGTVMGAAIMGVLAAATLLVALRMVFFYAPTEREMGIVQRIY